VKTQVKTELFATFDRSEKPNGQIGKPGWRIAMPTEQSHGGHTVLARDCVNFDDFIFGSREDAQRAIDALSEHGIRTRDDVLAMDRAEVVHICCSALMW